MIATFIGGYPVEAPRAEYYAYLKRMEDHPDNEDIRRRFLSKYRV
jgi:hypothetical protein